MLDSLLWPRGPQGYRLPAPCNLAHLHTTLRDAHHIQEASSHPQGTPGTARRPGTARDSQEDSQGPRRTARAQRTARDQRPEDSQGPRRTARDPGGQPGGQSGTQEDSQGPGTASGTAMDPGTASGTPSDQKNTWIIDHSTRDRRNGRNHCVMAVREGQQRGVLREVSRLQNHSEPLLNYMSPGSRSQGGEEPLNYNI